MILDHAERQNRLRGIRLLVMDVDGVLTDGTINYSSSGYESKSFHVSDGMGITLLHLAGVEVAWITGRKSDVVTRRAEELRVGQLLQGIRDKGEALSRLMQSQGFCCEQVAYIGDDWNDLSAFEVCGLRIAVVNGVREVLAVADMVTEKRGGEGAVREVIEALLDAQGVRDEVRGAYMDSLRLHPVDCGSGQ